MRGATREQPRLPWSGSTPTARACSYEGALSAQARSAAQIWAYFRFLRACGCRGATDHEAAEHLGIPVTSVCARRNWLMQEPRRLVRDSGLTRPGPTGVRNTVWQTATAFDYASTCEQVW